jgi:tetratricopeptide (TPR) repeat protein
MKSLIILLVGLCVGLACGVLYFKSQKAPSAPPPVVESMPETVSAFPESVVTTIKPAPPVTEPVPVPAPSPVTNSVASDPEAEAVAAFRKTIDTLLSPQLPPKQKHEMFEEFRKAGQMDQVIAELKRRAKGDPQIPEIPITLGEALLNKVGAIHAAGGDVNEMGILAMQADQSFNAALKMDPSNWEAQYVKYSTMFYWPPEPTRDNEVAQKLSGLIDQQEALPQQPHFAQTYVALGNQYQKLGKPDFAEATWRLGLTKFPNDPTLLKKLAPQP